AKLGVWLESSFVDSVPIHQGAIGGVEIADHVAPAGETDLRVSTGNGRDRQGDVGVGVASEDHRLLSQGKCRGQRPVALRVQKHEPSLRTRCTRRQVAAEVLHSSGAGVVHQSLSTLDRFARPAKSFAPGKLSLLDRLFATLPLETP